MISLVNNRTDTVHYEPKHKHTKKQYLDIFEDYKISGKTQAEIAEKYQITQGHVAKIVKWATQQAFKSNDSTIYKNITLVRLEKSLSKLETITTKLVESVDKAAQPVQSGADTGSDPEVDPGFLLLHSQNAVKNIAAIMKEVRLTHESIASLMGVMNATKNSGPVQVNVITPNIQRGVGVSNMKVVNDNTIRQE